MSAEPGGASDAGLDGVLAGELADLRAREGRLRALLDAAFSAIVTIDRAGVIRSANAPAVRMFGYPAGELVGRDVRLLLPDRAPGEADLAELWLAATPEPHPVGEFVVRRKDGGLVPVEAAVGQVDDMGLFAGVLYDISRRKALEREVVEIALLEQQRIGQDLHDDCGQRLTALGVLADALVAALEATDARLAAVARKVGDGARHVLRQVRNISRGLAQAEIDPDELEVALADLAARLGETSDVECTFAADGAARVADRLRATSLYHIAQEACTNALRHARPTRIDLRLRRDAAGVALEVEDDGVGIRDDTPEGLGRRIMRNRARVIGARLTVRPVEPRGTLVRCVLSS